MVQDEEEKEEDEEQRAGAADDIPTTGIRKSNSKVSAITADDEDDPMVPFGTEPSRTSITMLRACKRVGYVALLYSAVLDSK